MAAKVKKHRLKSRKTKAIRLAHDAFVRAIDSAYSRGFTGMLHSKGGLFDDPIVRRCKARYDKLTA